MSTTPQAEEPKFQFSGSRSFRHIQPKGKKATEYEETSLHMQHDPLNFATLGWPTRCPVGNPPYSDDTSAMRASNWWAFSDPDKVIYRSYVAMQAAQEETIDGIVEMNRASGALTDLGAAWATGILGTLYSAYACVEWGLFRTFAAAQRDARSDVISYAMVFNSGDKLRHAHDIALYDIELEQARTDFSGSHGQQMWIESPIFQPMRKMVEEMMYVPDWMEAIVAVNCVFEPRVGDLVRREILMKNAVLNGDSVTPILIGATERDWQRNRRWTDELVKLLLADAVHGEENRKTFRGWLEKWTPSAGAACEALRPLWDDIPTTVNTFDEALARSRAAADAHVAGMAAQP